MPAGERLLAGPTMRDVAREAGVSKALVSIVFRGAPGASPDNRSRVFAAAERLGYRPNRTASLLALSRTRQLGVVTDLHNSFHAEVADAVLAAADQAGYRVALNPWTAAHGEERAIATALEFRCEALLLVGSELPSDTIAAMTAGTPVISIGRHLDLADADTVRCSDEAGIEQIVDHLVELGHSRIAHVDGGSGAIAAARRRGFQRGMARHGLHDVATVVRGGRAEADGRRAGGELLHHADAPTAIVAFNDHCALGVIDACTSAGLSVPDQVSVAGYDDSPLAKLHAIDLTSVRQEAVELARWAVAAAVERLDQDRRNSREAVLIPRLVRRGSTSSPASPGPDREAHRRRKKIETGLA